MPQFTGRRRKRKRAYLIARRPPLVLEEQVAMFFDDILPLGSAIGLHREPSKVRKG
jgi:hypothetical protein